jgi:hypothetical protein
MTTPLRKLVQREPNGQRQRLHKHERVPPIVAVRLRLAAERGIRATYNTVTDPAFGSELGRLFLSKKISPREHSAGQRWAELAHRHHKAIDAPSLKAGNLERGVRSHRVDPDSIAGREERLADDLATRRFDAARKVLGGHERAVRILIEDDVCPDNADLDHVRSGLRALADHFRLH